jgi:hypothetical protein
MELIPSLAAPLLQTHDGSLGKYKILVLYSLYLSVEWKVLCQQIHLLKKRVTLKGYKIHMEL